MPEFFSDPATLYTIAAVLLMGLGVAGAVLPVLPGSPLILGGMLLLAWQNDFERVGWIGLTIQLLLVAASQLIDYVAGAAGAKMIGASRQAIYGALIGSLIGIFFGLPGLLLGPFLGALLGELLAHPDLLRAGKVGVASWLGFIVGSLLKLVIALLMLVVFAIDWWLI
ncbi:DUF456 domain-containing protein [Chitinilyticum litopenaei]|uniref:DUF456 domain-containing protein n=1 Tax=Chitinilyticum litopenaei TaxID=1121276 RepID=UPI000410C8FF|nr:DUF456 family protein [Chitinilyticum litopenaei]